MDFGDRLFGLANVGRIEASCRSNPAHGGKRSRLSWFRHHYRRSGLAAPSWLSRGMTVFSLVSKGVLADQLYYLTQRVGA
jgi:hypothetical protein